MVGTPPSPRRAVTARWASTMGPTVGNIMATIIVSHMAMKRGTVKSMGIRVPTCPSPMTMPDMLCALRTVSAQATAARPTRTANVTSVGRRPSRESAERGVSPPPTAKEVGRAMTALRRVRAAPVEGDVLARLPGPAPAEAHGVHPVGPGHPPGGDPPGADLRSGRVQGLDPLAGRGHGPGQRLGAGLDLARDARPPAGEVVGDLEVDGRELEAADLADQLGELGRKAARPTVEDGPERLALALVGALVEEDAHGDLGLAGPDVALEGAHGDHVQAVQDHVAVAALTDVPGQHPLAPVVGGRLGELAGAGDVAPADVEPVAGQPPLRNLRHVPISSMPRCRGCRGVLAEGRPRSGPALGPGRRPWPPPAPARARRLHAGRRQSTSHGAGILRSEYGVGLLLH